MYVGPIVTMRSSSKHHHWNYQMPIRIVAKVFVQAVHSGVDATILANSLYGHVFRVDFHINVMHFSSQVVRRLAHEQGNAYVRQLAKREREVDLFSPLLSFHRCVELPDIFFVLQYFMQFLFSFSLHTFVAMTSRTNSRLHNILGHMIIRLKE